MEVEVLKVYNTSLGMIGILEFPDGIIPKVNMKLKKGKDVYLIKGIAFNQPIEFEGDSNYACILDVQGPMINVGDILKVE